MKNKSECFVTASDSGKIYDTLIGDFSLLELESRFFYYSDANAQILETLT